MNTSIIKALSHWICSLTWWYLISWAVLYLDYSIQDWLLDSSRMIGASLLYLRPLKIVIIHSSDCRQAAHRAMFLTAYLKLQHTDAVSISNWLERRLTGKYTQSLTFWCWWYDHGQRQYRHTGFKSTSGVRFRPMTALNHAVIYYSSWIWSSTFENAG